MNEISPLTHRLQTLIASLSPQQRQGLAKKLGSQLAQSQWQRISQQQNPDGTPFIPRKRQKIQGQKGKIKQKSKTMFAKIKTARFLKTKAKADEVTLGYRGNEAYIARVHQFGLRSRVNRKQTWKVQYPQRELLGFTAQDLAMIEEEVLKQLAQA